MDEVKFKNQRWINLASPKKEDLEALAKRYKFHELDIEDCLQETQRPKIDEYDRYLFIVLHFPIYSKRHHRFDSKQLNVFIGENYLITIHDGTLPAIDQIFEACNKSIKEKKAYFGTGTGYLLYEILYSLFSSIFPITDKIQITLRRIEDDIFEASHPKDQLFDIMVVKKNIITLRKIILPQRSVVASLEHKQKPFLSEDLVIYFDDIVDKIEKLWNILETHKEVIESLEDTNESLLSHNINSTMRTLTVFSATMLPLTFLTGLFGMNVKLPFIEAMSDIDHFWNILIVMFVVIATMFVVFKWKKWL